MLRFLKGSRWGGALLLGLLFLPLAAFPGKKGRSYELDVEEPSGLAFDPSDNTFWTVSDEDACLYQLDKRGRVLREIETEGYDLEGVALSSEGIFYVLDESYREVLLLDREGRELGRIALEGGGAPNHGPEGIALLEERGMFYVLNEKEPGLLRGYDWEGELKEEYPLDFASDYAGLCYDEAAGHFLILSQEDRRLFFWTPQEGVLSQRDVKVETPEGICLDEEGRLFVVSDEESLLVRLPR